MAQTPLTNGGNHAGNISAGESDSFTFAASAGDTILLRVGATNFAPRIQLSGAGGVIATYPASAPGTGARDAFLIQQLSAGGTFTVTVNSFYPGQSGSYALRFGQIPGAASTPAGDEGGALGNGSRHPGRIDLGDLDIWTFQGNAGNSIELRMGAEGFAPRIDLYAPNGALVQSSPESAPGTGSRDSDIRAVLAASGTYTVVASSWYLGFVGDYALSLALAPQPVVVSMGDEGGPLTNGWRHLGSLEMGDLDVYTFAGSAGESISLRVGSTNFAPRIAVYSPAGSLITNVPSSAPGTGRRDALAELRLAESGMHTVVLGSYYYGMSGSYALSLAQVPGESFISPGDDGGVMQNGARYTGLIERGDLDIWKFEAAAGDSIQLRMGGTNMVPRIDLYDPSGAWVATAPDGAPSTGSRDAWMRTHAATAGTYTVVVSDYYFDLFGPYSLELAKAPGDVSVSPGDEGGPLANGARHPGTISMGELDVWTFTAGSGSSVQLRMSGESFAPALYLYGPNGALVAQSPASPPGTGSRDTAIYLQVTNTGSYTVVAAGYYLGFFGNYDLSFISIPGEFVVPSGDQGGPLTNGWAHAGAIETGDLDVWSFEGAAGREVVLRMGGTNFAPRLDLYAPDGSLVETAPASSPGTGNRDASIAATLPSTGTYHVVASSWYYGLGGGYQLTLAQPEGAASAAPGDEGGPMTNGFVYRGTNVMGDLDVWTFFGTSGDSNVFRIGTVDFTPWLRLYGPDGKLVREAFTVGTGVRTNQMTYVVTNSGTYLLVSGALYPNQFGSYNLKQSRVPPDINMPSSVTLNEGETLNVPISAQDPDVPDRTLAFAIESQPAGLTLATQGATNGLIAWQTTEAAGPATNTFIVKVTDVVNNTPFTRTNTFTVVVNELNAAPVLTLPPTTEVSELATLSVSATATDADIPANPLTFSLIDPPAGMTIDPATGAIRWVPAEEQGPGTYAITVVVADHNPAAVNANSLSATNVFTVVVREVNVSPQIAVPDQVIDEEQNFILPVIATDADRPANTLTYSLLNPPSGLSINPVSGLISWTPAESQGPGTNMVTVVATDVSPDAVNEKQLSASATFAIVVNEVNRPPSLPVVAPQSVNELATLTVTNAATDADLPANTLVYSLLGAPEGAAISASGVVIWTPTEAQGPTNVTITTVVRDSGSPQLSATNSFVVSVGEVHEPPTLTLPPGPIGIEEQQLFRLTVAAADGDLPANVLSFRLVSAPEGMAISSSGEISWTPTEEQGPGDYVVSVVVADDTALAATNRLTLSVAEKNEVPAIAEIAPQTIHFGTLLSIPLNVSDPDRPANALTLVLEGAPGGMALNAVSNVINWVPAEGQLGVYTVTVRATDDGAPALSATRSFQITVTGTGASITVRALPNKLVELTITADPGHEYELQRSVDLQEWSALVRVPIQSGPYQHIEPMDSARRFYQLKLLQ